MNLAQKTETWGNEDLSWLGSAHGLEMADSITIDRASMTAGWVTDGVIPAGVVLRKLAATGRYMPWATGDAAAGILISPVMVGASGNPQGAVIRHGQVIVSKLPATSGYSAGAVATAMAAALPLVDFV